MSVEHMTAVLHHSQATGTARLVLLGIANHEGDGGAFPKLRTLSKYAGHVTVRNVQKAIRQLEELGELRVTLRGGGTRNVPEHLRTNRYEVLVTCPEWCDRSAAHRDVRELDQPIWGT